jgi:hypothetical protein
VVSGPGDVATYVATKDSKDIDHVRGADTAGFKQGTDAMLALGVVWWVPVARAIPLDRSRSAN